MTVVQRCTYAFANIPRRKKMALELPMEYALGDNHAARQPPSLFES